MHLSITGNTSVCIIRLLYATFAKKGKTMFKTISALLMLIGLLLGACAPATPTPTPAPWPAWEDERIIPFQTIDVDNDSRPLLPESAGEPELTEKYDLRTAWPESVPTVSQLYKIESVADVEPLVGLLPTATIDYLRSVDYDANVVFALLRGQRGGGGFAVFIEQVAVGMGGVRVYAQFRVRTSGTDGYTFPYHIVKVKLSDLAWSALWMPVDFLARLCDDEQHPC
jgi:hypothetical protein